MDEKTRTSNILSSHLQDRFLRLVGQRENTDQPKERAWTGKAEQITNGALQGVILGVFPLAWLSLLLGMPAITNNFFATLGMVVLGGLVCFALLYLYKTFWVRKAVVALRRRQFRKITKPSFGTSTEEFQNWWRDVDAALREHRMGSLNFDDVWWTDLPHGNGALLHGAVKRKVTPLVDPEGSVWLVDESGTLMTLP